MGRIIGEGVKGEIMVEYKYFNRVYNEVTNKNFSDSFIFLKMIGMIMAITLLFVFTTMTKIVAKDT